jgi:hypothetical protein
LAKVRLNLSKLDEIMDMISVPTAVFISEAVFLQLLSFD